jgi:hypothetical protein
MRFPILKDTNRMRLKNVTSIVYACVILHNMLNAMGIPVPDVQAPTPDDDPNDFEDIGNPAINQHN